MRIRNTIVTLALSFPPVGLCLVAGCTLLNTRSDLIGGDPQSGDDGGTKLSDGAPVQSSHDGSNGDSTSTAQDGRAPVDAQIGADDADGDVVQGAVVLYDNRIVPGGLTVQGGQVCWVEGQMPRGIYCGPVAGGGLSAVHELDITGDLPLLSDAFDVALDDTYVYWSNGSNNQIIRRARSGGDPAQYFSGGGRISYITIEGTILFASDYTESGSSLNEVIYGPGVGGVSSNTAYTGQLGASGVAHMDTTVYWGTGNPNALNFGPEHGNAPFTSIATAAAVGGVAIDSQRTVYFVVGNRSIFKLTHGSVAPVPFYDAGGSFGTSDIAVDDTAVYWTERDNGKIMKMAK